MNRDLYDNKGVVGIISYGTFSDHMNYGAYLHSYAFQKVLQSYGVDSVIIDYRSKSLSKHSLKYPILNYRDIFDFQRFVFRFVNYFVGFFANLRKYRKMCNFVKTNEKTTECQYTYEQLQRVSNIEGISFRLFVCESDVIWKLYNEKGDFDENFFLSFPAAEKLKKVAYSPSLSSNKFSPIKEKQFVNFLINFSAISIREKQGARYVSSLLGREIEWVLDPTLLLSDADYSEIAVPPNITNYVLLYTCMKDDAQMVKYAETFAKEHNMKLIEVSNYSINKLLYHHTVKDDAGIEEWLGLFKNANYIICNAFHGFCFSVIFQKEMLLFLRTLNDFRMQNITEALGLQDRLVTSDTCYTNLAQPIDWDDVNKRWQQLKDKSLGFIYNNIVRVDC